MTGQHPHHPDEAEVVDLATARQRHTGHPDTPTANNPDTADTTVAEVADTDPDMADDPGGAVRVDSPATQRPGRPGLSGWAAAERRPILPTWARSRTEARQVTGWALGFLAHTSGYHAARAPKYAARLVLRAPRGGYRLARGWLWWLLDLSGEPVRAAAVRREDAEQYLALTRSRDRRVRWRGMATTAVAIAVIPAALAVAVSAPAWGRWGLLAAAVVGLGLAGRPADRPLLDTAVVAPKAQKLTSQVVVRALSVLGIGGITKALAEDPKNAIGFTAPISRDGPGWRAEVDLPGGVTAADVIERRDKLAAALSRPLGCVWPEANHDIHPGRLVLWVADQDMATARQPAWPLVRSGVGDLFRPFPFGTDARGRVVFMDLDGSNLLIGSIPGYGKTRANLIPLLVAALDPHAEIWDYDLKGVGDHKPISRVAARYVAGNTDEHIEAALAGQRDLRAELQRRQGVLDQLSDRDCPEGKVTPELALRKPLRLHQLLVNVDEAQELFSHPEFGKEAGELAEKNIRLGRALNVKLVFATQRPDARSLPTGVTANVGTRYCLRVMDQTANDMVLGTSAYKNGVRATMFTKKDKGVGWLIGAGDEAQIVRAFFIDGPTANRIIDRAVAAREKAGTLTGYAAGDGNPVPVEAQATASVLDDTLLVLLADQPKVWTETLLDRLARLRPEVYGGMGRDQLVAALRRHGVRTTQVWGTDPASGAGANRRGIDRADITTAITERDRRRPDRGAG